MKKDDKKTKSNLSLNISYKVIHSVMMVAIFPILIFVPMFRFIMTVSTSNSLGMIGSLLSGSLDINSIIKKATGIDVDKIPELWSLAKLKTELFSESSKLNGKELDFSVLPSKLTNPMICFAVFLCIAVLCGVVALILGIVLKRKWITGVVTGFGALMCLVSSVCFKTGAKLLVSGQVSVVDIIKKLPALAEYKSYLSFINIDIRILQLSSAVSLFAVILALATVFSLLMYYVEKNYSRK